MLTVVQKRESNQYADKTFYLILGLRIIGMTFRDEILPELSFLYTRALNEIEQSAQYESVLDLTVKDVLRAHFMIADFFAKEGEGIGGFGPKDIHMLVSAIGRQHVSFGGQEKWTSVHEKAATLLFGMVMNHPFHDANKRTAFLSTVHYLYVHGFGVIVTEKEFEDITVLVADHGLDKFRRFKTLKKDGVGDPEVRFLAHYLKKSTRKIDKKQYLVTYRELEKILRRYDVLLENPKNNSIDVMRWEDVTVKKGFFGKSRTTKEIRKVCSLGFPGWSKQVGKGRIAHIRKELGLTSEAGVDSQSFFYEVDDLSGLLAKYEGALRRLATR